MSLLRLSNSCTQNGWLKTLSTVGFKAVSHGSFHLMLGLYNKEVDQLQRYMLLGCVINGL